MNKQRLRRFLQVCGALAFLQGAVGLVHAFTGRPDRGLVRHIGFLDGREVYGGVALIVLALALFAVAGSLEED